jgi:hypothetical protein
MGEANWRNRVAGATKQKFNQRTGCEVSRRKAYQRGFARKVFSTRIRCVFRQNTRL